MLIKLFTKLRAIQVWYCFRNLLEKTTDALLKAAKVGDLKMVCVNICIIMRKHLSFKQVQIILCCKGLQTSWCQIYLNLIVLNFCKLTSPLYKKRFFFCVSIEIKTIAAILLYSHKC